MDRRKFIKTCGLVSTSLLLSNDVLAEVRAHFPALLYKTIIPRSVRLGEAPSYGQPINIYDPKSKATAVYRALAKEVIKHGK